MRSTTTRPFTGGGERATCRATRLRPPTHTHTRRAVELLVFSSLVAVSPVRCARVSRRRCVPSARLALFFSALVFRFFFFVRRAASPSFSKKTRSAPSRFGPAKVLCCADSFIAGVVCTNRHRHAPMPAHAVPAAPQSLPLLLPPPPAVQYAPAEPRFRRCVRKFFAHLFSNLGLFGLVAGYVIVGAFVFRFLEAGNERQQRDRIGRLKNDCLGELWNITGTWSKSCCLYGIFFFFFIPDPDYTR